MFVPSLSVHMPSNFLAPWKTAGISVGNIRNIEKLSLESLEKSGSFCNRNPEVPV